MQNQRSERWYRKGRFMASAQLPPVSKVCPSCGGQRYRKVRPRRWIAFISDRVCLDCQTRYVPPTPKWGGVVFIFVGIVLVIAGLIPIVGTFHEYALRGGQARTSPLGILEGLWLLCLGGLACRHGYRAILLAGKV